MTKKDLVRKMAEKSGMTQKGTKAVLNSLMESIEEALVDGDEVKLSKFGTFKSVVRAPRKGRNPQTGEEIDIPEKVVPKFKTSSILKEKVQ